MARNVVDYDSDLEGHASHVDKVRRMNAFKKYKPDGIREELDKFYEIFNGVAVQDLDVRMRFRSGTYLCIVMYEETAHCYSVTWYKNEREMDNFPEYRDTDLKNIWTKFWAGCILYFPASPDHQGLYSVSGFDFMDNNSKNQRRAAAGPASASGPLQDFVKKNGRGAPPPYQRSEFKQEHNPKHVISMLYELRDMCRSMHDGARTLR